MNTDIKQAMHVEAGKSFGTSEANENERHWNDDKIDRKNQDPTNHYDKTRMKLNFEIGPDGKVHPLGYQEKSLEVRLQERLTELGWKPFKPDSKIQPNCCAKFIFGGNHDRTLEMAFGPQTVNLDKGADQATYPECIKIVHVVFLLKKFLYLHHIRNPVLFYYNSVCDTGNWIPLVEAYL